MVGARPFSGANTEGAVVGVPGELGCADGAGAEREPPDGSPDVGLGAADGFGLLAEGAGAATSGSSSDPGSVGAADSVVDGARVVGALVVGDPVVGAFVVGDPVEGAAVVGGEVAGAAVAGGAVVGAGSEPDERNS